MTSLIADLSSAEFSKRQNASMALREVSAEQMPEISTALASNINNEVSRRLIEILEQRYEKSSLDSDEVRVASEALEAAADAERWCVAETARDVLDRHWQRRTELAVIELIEMKASLSPADPTKLWKADEEARPGIFGRMDPTSAQHLKIFVDSAWPQDPRAFELVKRLDGLKSGSLTTHRRLVSIYLLPGHPLAIEQIAILKGIFGDNSIAERGKVCLGVVEEPRFGTESGVLVGIVKKMSSADEAGIRPGDLIIGLNGKKLTNFEQLVTELKKYEVGDKIVLQLQSNRSPEALDVEVTLKPWE